MWGKSPELQGKGGTQTNPPPLPFPSQPKNINFLFETDFKADLGGGSSIRFSLLSEKKFRACP